MANHNTKLELTWIGMENRPKLDPRILVEERAKSRHVPFRVRKNDFLYGGPMFEDKLSGLKALSR